MHLRKLANTSAHTSARTYLLTHTRSQTNVSDADLLRNVEAGGESGGDNRLSINNNHNYNNNNNNNNNISMSVEAKVDRTPISSETATLAVKMAAEASTIVS